MFVVPRPSKAFVVVEKVAVASFQLGRVHLSPLHELLRNGYDPLDSPLPFLLAFFHRGNCVMLTVERP